MKKWLGTLIVTSVLILALGSLANAATIVPSTITQDTVWSAAYSPYLVNGTVIEARGRFFDEARGRFFCFLRSTGTACG